MNMSTQQHLGIIYHKREPQRAMAFKTRKLRPLIREQVINASWDNSKKVLILRKGAKFREGVFAAAMESQLRHDKDIVYEEYSHETMNFAAQAVETETEDIEAKLQEAEEYSSELETEVKEVRAQVTRLLQEVAKLESDKGYGESLLAENFRLQEQLQELRKNNSPSFHSAPLLSIPDDLTALLSQRQQEFDQQLAESLQEQQKHYEQAIKSLHLELSQIRATWKSPGDLLSMIAEKEEQYQKQVINLQNTYENRFKGYEKQVNALNTVIREKENLLSDQKRSSKDQQSSKVELLERERAQLQGRLNDAQREKEQLNSQIQRFGQERASYENKIRSILAQPQAEGEFGVLMQYASKLHKLDKLTPEKLLLGDTKAGELALSRLRSLGLSAGSVKDIGSLYASLVQAPDAQENIQRIFQAQNSQLVQAYTSARNSKEPLQSHVDLAKAIEDSKIQKDMLNTAQRGLEAVNNTIAQYERLLQQFREKVITELRGCEKLLQAYTQEQEFKDVAQKADCSRLPIHINLQEEDGRYLFTVLLPAHSSENSKHGSVLDHWIGQELQYLGARRSAHKSQLVMYEINVKKSADALTELCTVWNGIKAGYAKTDLRTLGVHLGLQFSCDSASLAGYSSKDQQPESVPGQPSISTPPPTGNTHTPQAQAVPYDIVKSLVAIHTSPKFFKEELADSMISAGYKMESQDLERSLKQLEEAGLITSTKFGRNVTYTRIEAKSTSA
jgi:hypothetical protein